MTANLRWYWNRIKSYVGRPRLVIQHKPVVLDGAERCEHPLFVLGAHRSGTSLVRRMLNAHPEISCPPESFFIAHYAAMLDDGFCIAGYDGFGYDREAMRKDLADKASALHEALRIARGKSIWADKTPRYLDDAEAIDRLFAGKPRYLLVYRHPLDIIHSLFKRGWKQNDIEDDFESALAYVREAIERLDAFHANHPERCARIEYGALCADTAGVLRVALEKIGLDYHPAMLEFGSKQHNFGLEDPVIRGNLEIKPSAGAWRSWKDGMRARAAEVFGKRALEDDYWGTSGPVSRSAGRK